MTTSRNVRALFLWQSLAWKESKVSITGGKSVIFRTESKNQRESTIFLFYFLLFSQDEKLDWGGVIDEFNHSPSES